MEEKFYFIHFEYLLHYEDDDEFYPAEMALVEYSIFSGMNPTIFLDAPIVAFILKIASGLPIRL